MSTTANPLPSLEQSVTQAIESQGTQQVQQTQQQNVENTQTQQTQQTQETQTQQSQQTQEPQVQQQQQQQQPTAEEVTAQQKEQEQALNVYRLLNDPNTAPAVVKMLAEQLGITQPQVKNTQKEPGVAEILQQALGEEYSFLAPKLAEGIEKVIERAVTPLQQQVQRESAKVEFQTALDRINNTTKGDFNKYESKITALMDEIKPAPGVSVEKYLSNLYTIAKNSGGPPPPSQQVQQVVNRMQQNAQERIPSPSAATENRVVKGPVLPSLEDAISAALRGERFE